MKKPEKSIVKDYYFKKGNNISGIDLPDLVKDTIFIGCTFHPNCWVRFGMKYENCSFIDCHPSKETLLAEK